MKIKYTTTEKFHKGDSVWLSGFATHPSGRLKYSQSPIQVNIKDVTPQRIEIEFGGYNSYYIPTVYYLDVDDNSYYPDRHSSLEYNIAFTKEEAIQNYNRCIKEEINEHFYKPLNALYM